MRRFTISWYQHRIYGMRYQALLSNFPLASPAPREPGRYEATTTIAKYITEPPPPPPPHTHMS